MSLPNNKIRVIIPPDGISYEIVPSLLQDGTTSYSLSVPTLGADDTIVTLGTNQTITGEKVFTNGINVGNASTTGGDIVGSSYNGFTLKGNSSAGSFLEVQDSNGNITTSSPHTYFKINSSPSGATQFVFNNGYSSNLYRGTLNLPITGTTAKTLATTDDIPSITITTTTGSESISDGTNTLNIVTRDTNQTISGDKIFTTGVFLNDVKSSFLKGTNGVTLHSTTSLNLESAGTINITPPASNGYVNIANSKIYVRTSPVSALTQISFSDSYLNSGTTVTANYTFPTLSKAAGDYIIATTDDILAHQASVTIVKNALTNINGRVLSAYEATLGSVPGQEPGVYYTIYTITYGNVTLTEEKARDYMEYMTGARFLPVYNYEKPQNDIFVFADDGNSLWKPQWDSTNGLILYRLNKGLVDCQTNQTINGVKSFDDRVYINNAIYGNGNLYLVNSSNTQSPATIALGVLAGDGVASITATQIGLRGDVEAKFLSLNNGSAPAGIEIYGGDSVNTPYMDWHRRWDSTDDYDLRLIMDNTRTLSLISRVPGSATASYYAPTFRIGSIAMTGYTDNEFNLKVGAGSTLYIGYRNCGNVSGYAVDAYVFGKSNASSSGRGDVYANIHNDSDRRLKENFTDSTIENYTKLIEDIPLVDYNYIGNDIPQLGVIAQDLEEILPERYKKEFIGKHRLREKDGDNTEYLSIVESKLVYLCIGAIKELSQEIKELKEKLKEK